MKFSAAIDDFIADKRSQGRINSGLTESSYRRVLNAHCDDVTNRDPSKTGRDDVKRTLRRWPHPNSQRQAHSVLASFYDWAMQEGIRETNPARQAIRAKARKATIFRPTRDEVIRLLDASMTDRRDKWAIHLGVLAGARNMELRGLQPRHFERGGFVWISPDIGKGGKERWMPVTAELQPIVDEILRTLGPDEYVVHSRRRGSPLVQTRKRDLLDTPLSQNGLLRLVARVGKRAKLGADITPHTLRHAFGDHIARYAGLRAAQAMLGHESVQTTETFYTGQVSLDELMASVNGFTYRRLPAPIHPANSSTADWAHYGGNPQDPPQSHDSPKEDP